MLHLVTAYIIDSARAFCFMNRMLISEEEADEEPQEEEPENGWGEDLRTVGNVIQ
jgi:hypothetical protein